MAVISFKSFEQCSQLNVSICFLQISIKYSYTQHSKCLINLSGIHLISGGFKAKYQTHNVGIIAEY